MAFTQKTDFTFKHVDQAGTEFTGGGDVTTVKTKLDSQSKELRDYINDVLLPELQAVTDGDSGADNVGMTPITETGAANTVQTIVEALITLLKSVTDSNSGADLIGMTPITETGSANRVQAVIETLITKLKATTDSASGADLIGATAIAGLTGSTTQAIMESLKNKIDTINPMGGFYNPKDSTYGAIGNGTTDDYAAINSVITAIGSSNATIIFTPGTYKISTNITFPANVTIWFTEGAKLSPDSSKTITINGNVITAGLHQIFTGAGTIAGLSKLTAVYPQWWGAVGNGVADDTAPIQKAVNIGGVIMFPFGTYLTTSTITVTNPSVVLMSEQGYYNPIIKCTTASVTMFLVENYGFKIKGIMIIGDGTNGNGGNDATTTAIKLEKAGNNDLDAWFDYVDFLNHTLVASIKTRNVQFRNCTFSNSLKVVQELGGYADARGLDIQHCRFHSCGYPHSVKNSIAIDIAATVDFKELILDNNYIDDCEIFFSGGFGKGSISNNHYYRAYGSLVVIDNSSLSLSVNDRQTEIVGNKLHFQETTNASHGIRVKGVSKYNISKNMISRAQYHGIYTEVVNDAEIHDNHIVDCGYDAGATYDGIHLDVDSVFNSVKNNMIRKIDAGCGIRNGIRTEGSENEFENNSTRGITAGNEFYVNPTNKLAYGDTRCAYSKPRIHYGTAAPVSGRWSQGDYVENTNPTELGSAGSKYFINGWKCLSGGTPGTWVADRRLTGN